MNPSDRSERRGRQRARTVDVRPPVYRRPRPPPTRPAGAVDGGLPTAGAGATIRRWTRRREVRGCRRFRRGCRRRPGGGWTGRMRRGGCETRWRSGSAGAWSRPSPSRAGSRPGWPCGCGWPTGGGRSSRRWARTRTPTAPASTGPRPGPWPPFPARPRPPACCGRWAATAGSPWPSRTSTASIPPCPGSPTSSGGSWTPAFAGHPVAAGAGQEAVTVALAAFAGFLLDGARLPPPPGLPTLRAFQLGQGWSPWTGCGAAPAGTDREARAWRRGRPNFSSRGAGPSTSPQARCNQRTTRPSRTTHGPVALRDQRTSTGGPTPGKRTLGL